MSTLRKIQLKVLTAFARSPSKGEYRSLQPTNEKGARIERGISKENARIRTTDRYLLRLAYPLHAGQPAET